MTEPSPTRDLLIVKLGGSLLTDKRGEAAARHDVLARLAAEIAAARPAMTEQLVLGHGSGSFGHVAAARHGLGQPGARPAVLGVAVTQSEAARLHRLVIDAFLEQEVPAFSIAPSSALMARAGRPVSFALSPFLGALDLGLLPVVYGDVVTDLAWGASICSTETVVLALVRRLRARGRRVRRLLWLGETAGVWGPDGRTVESVDRAGYRALRRAVGAAAGTDVTGGMLHRLDAARALSRLGIESWIVDGTIPGLLRAALLGEEVPGTRFLADA